MKDKIKRDYAYCRKLGHAVMIRKFHYKEANVDDIINQMVEFYYDGKLKNFLKKNVKGISRKSSKHREETFSRRIAKNIFQFLFNAIIDDMIENEARYIFPVREFGAMMIGYRIDTLTPITIKSTFDTNFKIYEPFITMSTKAIFNCGLKRYYCKFGQKVQQRVKKKVTEHHFDYVMQYHKGIKTINRYAKRMYDRDEVPLENRYYRRKYTESFRFDKHKWSKPRYNKLTRRHYLWLREKGIL